MNSTNYWLAVSSFNLFLWQNSVNLTHRTNSKNVISTAKAPEGITLFRSLHSLWITEHRSASSQLIESSVYQLSRQTEWTVQERPFNGANMTFHLADYSYPETHYHLEISVCRNEGYVRLQQALFAEHCWPWDWLERLLVYKNPPPKHTHCFFTKQSAQSQQG